MCTSYFLTPGLPSPSEEIKFFNLWSKMICFSSGIRCDYYLGIFFLSAGWPWESGRNGRWSVNLPLPFRRNSSKKKQTLQVSISIKFGRGMNSKYRELEKNPQIFSFLVWKFFQSCPRRTIPKNSHVVLGVVCAEVLQNLVRTHYEL